MFRGLQQEDVGLVNPFIFQLSSRLFFQSLSHEFFLIAPYFLGGSLCPWRNFAILRDVSGGDMRILHVY